MLKPEIKKLVDAGKMLPLMEAFYTIQGEGYHKGTAAYFIRVGGCDVGCHWGDVKESWDADVHPPTAIETIAVQATEFSDTIVVTGGEPLMWDMQPLTNLLKEKKLVGISLKKIKDKAEAVLELRNTQMTEYKDPHVEDIIFQ